MAPLKRGRGRPRKYPKAKPSYRSMYRKSGISRSISNRPHLFKRIGNRLTLSNSNTGTLTVVGGSDSGFTLGTGFVDTITDTKGYAFSHNFRLSQMPNSTEFTSLFDKYKICKVVWTIMFQHNQGSINGNAVLPLLHVAEDDDDNTVPGGLGELLQRSNCKRRVLGNSIIVKYTVRPKIAASVYNSAVSSGYAVKSGYINTDYADVPHYGIKGIINNLWLTTNNNVGITIEPTYYLALKEVK